MASVTIIYTLVYILVSICLVAPPTEFISAGLTVQNLFANYIGSEDMNFVYYHIKRTTVTVIFHSFFPLGYYIGLGFSLPELRLFTPWHTSVTVYWKFFLTVSVILPLCVILLVSHWRKQKWSNHPISQTLVKYTPEMSSWHSVASSVNIEFRRIDKFSTGVAGQRLIVTDSWIMKTSTYTVYIGHQSDIHLSLFKSEEHELSHESQTGVQYLTIRVSSLSKRCKPFNIRLNALEYGDLKEKLQSQVQNARNVVIKQTLSDRFLDVFTQQVKSNDRYIKPPDVELESCIGCMQKDSNIKLQKLCDVDSEGDCTHCYCRPMWCLECIGKWFVNRQLQKKNEPETWMSSQAPCPTCRAIFCMLDVCLVI